MLVAIIKKFYSFSGYRVYRTRCNGMNTGRQCWRISWQDTTKIAVSIIQEKRKKLLIMEREEKMSKGKENTVNIFQKIRVLAF